MIDPDRVLGCVLGLALGDALGAPFESRRASEIPREWSPLALPGVFGPPGATTDDTALARNLVRSLAATGTLDEEDLAGRHVRWLATSPPDAGYLTRTVLSRIAAGEPAGHASRAVWEARGPERAATNGSVMYCAPLGAAYASRPARDLLEAADRLSGITHHDERCRAACQVVTLAVAALVRGEDRARAVERALRSVHEAGRPEEVEELAFMLEAAGVSRPVDGPDRGYVMFAAGIGLRALGSGGEFEPALREVIALGGDTDTNAALAGALLGAAFGKRGLPPSWLERLAEREGIERDARMLVPLAQSSGPTASST